eukprot:7217501-Pyramimonas_sp.AAC.1
MTPYLASCRWAGPGSGSGDVCCGIRPELPATQRPWKKRTDRIQDGQDGPRWPPSVQHRARAKQSLSFSFSLCFRSSLAAKRDQDENGPRNRPNT